MLAIKKQTYRSMHGFERCTGGVHTWELHQRTNLNIRRTGFCLVLDFIITARMIRGQYLGKVIKISPYHVLVASLFEFHFSVRISRALLSLLQTKWR